MPKATDFTHKIECQLVNKHGIHIRTAAILVDICERYDAEVLLKTPRGESDGRDMMRLLTLEAGSGTTLMIEATGQDKEKVLQELARVISAGFDDQNMK